MWELLAKGLLKLLATLVPFTLRKYYTSERLASTIKVRIDSEGDGLELWAGNVPYLQFWLVLANTSPFPVVLTGLEGHLAVASGVGNFVRLKQLVLRPGEEGRIFIRSNLDLMEFQYFHTHRNAQRHIEVQLHLHFSSSIRSFAIEKALRTTHLQYVNFESPVATWIHLTQESN